MPLSHFWRHHFWPGTKTWRKISLNSSYTSWLLCCKCFLSRWCFLRNSWTSWKQASGRWTRQSCHKSTAKMRKRASLKTTKARESWVDLFRLRNIENNLHVVGAKKTGCSIWQSVPPAGRLVKINTPQITVKWQRPKHRRRNGTTTTGGSKIFLRERFAHVRCPTASNLRRQLNLAGFPFWWKRK